MIPIPLGVIKLLVVGGAFALSVGSCAYQKHERTKVEQDLKVERDNFAVFKGGIEALGRAAQKNKDLEDAKNEQRRIVANTENAASVAALRRELDGLRSKRAERDTRGSFVPLATGAGVSIKTACYDGAKLDDALRAFDRGIQGLITQGDTAVVDLNTAKKWAQR